MGIQMLNPIEAKTSQSPEKIPGKQNFPGGKDWNQNSIN